MEKKEKPIFDEKQKLLRRQYGFEAFLLLAALVTLIPVLSSVTIAFDHPVVNNPFQSKFSNWYAVLIAASYWNLRCVWGEASRERGKKPPVHVAPFLLFVAAYVFMWLRPAAYEREESWYFIAACGFSSIVNLGADLVRWRHSAAALSPRAGGE